MRRAPSISAAQFFGTAFGCRAALTIALNGRWAAGENLLDGAFSCLGAMGLGLLLALPVGLLFRRCPDQPIGEQAVQLFGQGGKAVSLCYLAYFLVMNGVSLGLF